MERPLGKPGKGIFEGPPLLYHNQRHNGTGAPSFGYSLENQRRDLEGLIKNFNIQNPILISLAFGTTIAADYAIHHPERSKALC